MIFLHYCWTIVLHFHLNGRFWFEENVLLNLLNPKIRFYLYSGIWKGSGRRNSYSQKGKNCQIAQPLVCTENIDILKYCAF